MSPAFIYTSTEQFVKHHFTKFTLLAAVTILLKATDNVTEGYKTWNIWTMAVLRKLTL